MTRLSHAGDGTAFNAHAPQRELSLPEARARVLAEADAQRRRQPPRREPATLAEAPPGRVLAATVGADRDWPPFPRAMRDGYALRAADLAASASLECIGEVQTGGDSRLVVAPGACVAIMTGAPVPAGADTVVMIERTRRLGERIHFELPVRGGDNIAAPGSDAAAGALAAAAGRRLGPATLAVLAQAGCTAPEVFAAPRVAILATGDELVGAAATPGPAQIRNSNGPMLAALARRAGAAVTLERQVADRAPALREALEAAVAGGADLVLFSGGASVGAHDLVAPVLAAAGAEFFFDAVRMRPGRPQLFGRVAERLFFGLPGNPLGSLMGFLLLVRPALELLAGLEEAALPPACAAVRLEFAYRGKALALAAFRPVRLQATDDGLPRAHSLPYHGSADLVAAAAADAFLMVPPGVEEMAAGDTAMVVMA